MYMTSAIDQSVVKMKIPHREVVNANPPKPIDRKRQLHISEPINDILFVSCVKIGVKTNKVAVL
ncbi:MAG: hypothetical protein ACK5LT_11790 [Lachnospirales bacterium]